MRVATGFTRRRRHKKVLKLTKGFRMTKGRLYKVSHEAAMHAGQYSYNHRQRRPSELRKIWNLRISAGAKANGTSYSVLTGKLKKADVQLDRKMLADIALNHPGVFTKVVEAA
ncbi:MAG: 50S ribosomal protein L20 [Candidatus Dojkabacteria bacterium]